MAREYADVCSECGKVVVKKDEAGSSDMVLVKSIRLLYLSDEYLPGKLSRPSLSHTDDIYCPSCLLKMIIRWVNELKELKPSQAVKIMQATPQ